MRRGEAVDVGEIVRRAHWRAWDLSVEAPEASLAEVVAALPVLIESGSAGIVWPRLRKRFGADHPAGMALEAAARAQAEHNARAERELARVVERLEAHGIRPVLIKGLAVARLYPSSLVRPAGDLDLVVRDEDYAAATAALAGWRLSFHGDRVAHLQADQRNTRTAGAGNVDLHRFSSWYGGGSRDFFERTVRVDIGGTAIEVPAPEDHLRALCLHFLWHGGARPIRLCDIAALLETEAGGMDWDRLLSGTAAEREHVMVALRLADEALGARMADAPGEVRDHELPAWVRTAMLERWERGSRPLPHRRDLLRGPVAAYRVFASRWPDPISAVMRSNGSFAPSPRFWAPAMVFANHWLFSALSATIAQVRGIQR